jgi:hypothetical protein
MLNTVVLLQTSQFIFKKPITSESCLVIGCAVPNTSIVVDVFAKFIAFSILLFHTCCNQWF